MLICLANFEKLLVSSSRNIKEAPLHFQIDVMCFSHLLAIASRCISKIGSGTWQVLSAPKGKLVWSSRLTGEALASSQIAGSDTAKVAIAIAEAS